MAKTFCHRAEASGKLRMYDLGKDLKQTTLAVLCGTVFQF